MKIGRLLLVMLALGLSACSSLDGKTPYEMVNVSMQRSLTKDYQYNFASETRVYGSEYDKGLQPDSKSKPSVKERSSMAGKAADALKDYPALAYFVANGRLNISGAVDWQAEKVELIPELSVHNRNDHSAVRMPILLDGKDMSITADMPTAVPLVLNFMVEPALRERLVHEPIRFALADAGKSVQNKPIKTWIKALLFASSQAYAGIPAEQFQSLPLDEFAKHSQAKYRIGLAWNQKVQQAYFKAFANHWAREFDRLQKESPEANVSEQAYRETRKASLELFEEFVMEEDWQGAIFGQAVMRNLYLDGKGRLVGYREYVQINGNKQALNMDTQIKLFNFGRPQFTFQPATGNYITFTELLQSMKTNRSAK